MINLLKKMFSIALCAALVGGAGVALPAVAPDSGITANAADTITYGDYRYQVNEDETICIVGYNGSDSELAIPATIEDKYVTSIGYHAFSGCQSLTSVTIPDSVTSIGVWAFEDCASLTSITIPHSVTSIGRWAFENTAWYDDQPDGLVYAGNVAYKYKGEMPENTSIILKDGTKEISGGAFEYCTNLTNIIIPDSVTRINAQTFMYCSGLTSITIPNGVTSIGDGAFSGCTGLTSITILGNLTSIDGTRFGFPPFEDCTNLTNITISDSVTNINDNFLEMFETLYSLTSIIVDSNNTVYSSQEGVLFNKDKTMLIRCPRGKKGSYSIPNSVTSIGNSAFYGCTGLTSITIPDGVTSIGKYAFYNCKNLTSITIPDSVTSIDNGAFYGCDSLTSVTIPDSVTSIGESAFEDCTSLTSITIGNGAPSIGYNAFSGCTNLTSLIIPDSVTRINGDFLLIDSLTNIIVDSNNSVFSSQDGVLFDKNKSALSKCPKGKTGSYSIPDSVTSIDWLAFYGCTGLTSITIPDSVTSIDRSAFSGCENLIIYGKKGSYAETYAKENSFTFIAKVFPLKNVSTIETTATVGEPITLNAKAEGGEGDYTYALMYKKSTSDTWTKIGKKYGTASTGSFTPGKAVKYDVMINVKDATGKVKSKTFTVDVKAQLKNKTTINAETVKVGEKIVLKGAASGGTVGYKYAFYYKKSKNSDWLELIEPYTTKSISFKPKSATSYDLKSVVKDASGRTTEKIFTVKVTK